MPLWRDGRLPPLFEQTPWQMQIGERAALEGLLASYRPGLAVEIGTAEGGSLARIATYAGEVHSFDLVPPQPELVEGLDNVTLHTGDSGELLPAFLEQLASEGRNVDFALVDGCHETEMVRRDLEQLLASPAMGSGMIVMHDTANEQCRRGIESVDWLAHDKVRWIELDAVSGFLFAGANEGQIWGGLGIVLIDADAGPAPAGDRRPGVYHPNGPLLWRARDAARLEAAAAERDAARAELEHLRRMHHAVTTSPSWRLTAPLRAAKAALQPRR